MSSIYLTTRIAEPTTKSTGSQVTAFRGVSFDLDAQVAETVRDYTERIYSDGRWRGWTANPLFEGVSLGKIYEVPLNTMCGLKQLRTIYAGRVDRTDRTQNRYYWGRIGLPVTQDEIDARMARYEYRQAHKYATDPMKAYVDKLAKKLPPPIKNAPTVYLVTADAWWGRRFGIFTTYEEALVQAPPRATIVEVVADGRTNDYDAKLVRGSFSGQWGYAIGYAPATKTEVA